MIIFGGCTCDTLDLTNVGMLSKKRINRYVHISVYVNSFHGQRMKFTSDRILQLHRWKFMN